MLSPSKPGFITLMLNFSVSLFLVACGGGDSGTDTDVEAPSVPTALSVKQRTPHSITISWAAAVDNVGVSRYEILLNGGVVGNTTTTDFTFADLDAATLYRLSIKAVDTAGNASLASSELSASTDSQELACSAGDSQRVFFNDFESGEAFGPDVHKHFSPSSNQASRGDYAILDGALMGGRSGKVLRGNMWEWVNGDQAQGQAYDPLAASMGITIKGSKRPSYPVRLSEIGIVQVPSSNPLTPSSAQSEVYLSFWLWFDEDFNYTGLSENGVIRDQGVKLFYAFGPDNLRWVTALQPGGWYNLFINYNDHGNWFNGSGVNGPRLEGNWRHFEMYFRSETKSLYYESGTIVGNASKLASQCPNPVNYTMMFPVVGSSPQSCLSYDEALAENSKDGIYILKVDGQVVLDFRNVPFNGRFAGITIPAWHGGGGQSIASSGWALDDYCVRKSAPPGFVP